MTTPPHETDRTDMHHAPDPGTGDDRHGTHAGHGLVMLMCVPMLLIAGFLVVTGAAGSGALVAALLCMGMMAAMTFMMPGGHRHK